MPGPVSYLKRTGFRRGVVGNDRRWLAVWAGVTVAGFVRRRLGRREEVVLQEELEPGQTLVIEHMPH